ncbi:copper amine oxidase N-terminal domain-containing protein [Paenibacillus sp. GCM10028914]|uniref:copper amine oxidase N-terminal domain-containing protein n=1 Tax=Paenibacillus sp. GCM10028914 TaxID=3273416 RepID=UPI00361B7D65
MNFRGLKRLTATAIFATLLTPSFLIPQAEAASTVVSPVAPKAFINSDLAYGEVLIREGTTFITLTDLKPLGDYTYKYDSAKKQITISSKDTKVVVTAGSKLMQVNGANKTLTNAPFLHKGKTMVPLRAVSMAFHAKIYWNAPTKTVFIAKPDPNVVAGLHSESLTTARNAALYMPRVSLIPQDLIERTYLEMQGQDYYFPKNRADMYFELDNDLVSYYKIRNNTAELKWQAKLHIEKGKDPKSNFFILPYHFTKEIGQQPDIKDLTFARFRFRYPVGSTFYSMVNSKGEYAFGDVELDNHSPNYEGVIVEIPEEADDN